MKRTIIIISVIALIGLFVYPLFIKNVKADSFEGIITNIEIEPGIYEGTGVYDRSCNPVENGMTQCDAGIQIQKGLVNFNYKHNMRMQKCIDAGQILTLEVLEGGKAIVTRK